MALEESLSPYERFIESVENPFTRHQYVNGLSWFLEFSKTTPDELVKSSPTAIEDAVKRHLKHLEKTDKSYSTRAAVVNSLRKFLKVNKVKDVDFDEIRQRLGEDETERGDQPYSTELIDKLMQAADLRKKVIVGILGTAGIRRGALAPLKLKHTIKMTIPETDTETYALEIYANSRRSRYFTFVTPEIASVIDQYLKAREAAGEKLGPDSPLVREQYDNENVNKPRHVTTSTITQLVTGLVNQAGLKKEIRRLKIHQMHAFRKRVYSELVNAGVKEISIKKIIGHSTGLGRNYDRTELSELLKDYAKAIPSLTISKAPELQRQVKELEVKVGDVDTIKRAYLDVKQQLERSEEARKREKAEDDKKWAIVFKAMKRNPNMFSGFKDESIESLTVREEKLVSKDH